MKPRSQRRKAWNKLSCENCGTKNDDDLVVYDLILGGIRLCDDCADLPISKVAKRGVAWVKVKGEFFPPDFPIAQKEKEKDEYRRK